jgi:hypothetical protein
MFKAFRLTEANIATLTDDEVKRDILEIYFGLGERLGQFMFYCPELEAEWEIANGVLFESVLDRFFDYGIHGEEYHLFFREEFQCESFGSQTRTGRS